MDGENLKKRTGYSRTGKRALKPYRRSAMSIATGLDKKHSADNVRRRKIFAHLIAQVARMPLPCVHRKRRRMSW